MNADTTMGVGLDNPAEEIKGLQRGLNDLASLLALPALWSGGEASEVAHALLDVLPGMLHLDLLYVRLKKATGGGALEMARVTHARNTSAWPREIGEALNHRLGEESARWPPRARISIGNGDISMVPLQLGVGTETGVLLAGSRRADFPGRIEKLLLSVAANQAAIGFQQACVLRERKRVALELDRQIAQQTRELIVANAELTKEIEDRKEMQEKLRRSEAFLAEAQRLSSTGSFSWRVSTDEITWSEQLHRIFEIDPALPVTLDRIRSRVHPEDLCLLDETIDQARDNARDFEHELRLLMPDGCVKYVHLVAHWNQSLHARPEYIGAVQDVTQRRFSEAALSRVRSELAHVARVSSLGTFTASIAHEVNQPLSGIITNASTCFRMLAADPPNIEGARETVRRTLRDANRASDVVTRVRSLVSKQDAVIDSVDLNEATREVIALSVNELQRSKVVLHLELADDIPVVAGDRVQLQQVILNLLLNASDAMSGIDDRPRELAIRTEWDGDNRVNLSVRDAGAGFEPQNLDRLFEPFYTTKREGMGIGLAVSRSIIDSHQGRLWAAANEGPGAAFTFSIPCKRETRAKTMDELPRVVTRVPVPGRSPP